MSVFLGPDGQTDPLDETKLQIYTRFRSHLFFPTCLRSVQRLFA